MKSGQVPIHIMRWAPSDFVNDPFVKLLVAREDFPTLSLYFLVLNWSHLEGGDLPSDTEQLAAVVGMRPKQVAKSLKVCTEAGKLVVDGARVYHRRVVREVTKELAFREKQAELGKKGGRPPINKEAEGKPKATLSDHEKGSQSPPSPSPSPSPTPFADAFRLSPSPEERRGETTSTDDSPREDPKPLLVDEAKCPDCGASGTLRRQRDGNGWFCGTRLGGCAAMFELAEPAIVKQLSERARESIRARIDRDEPAPEPEAPIEADPEPPPGEAAAVAAWDAVLAHMHSRISDQSWSTWLRPTHGVRFDGSTLVVWVPKKQHADWIENAFKKPLDDSVRATGLKRTIQFECSARPPL